MKPALLLSLVAVSFALAACGGEKTDTAKPASTTTPAATVTGGAKAPPAAPTGTQGGGW